MATARRGESRPWPGGRPPSPAPARSANGSPASKREQEPASLEVGAADRLEHRQPRHRRPAQVDSRQVHRGDLALVAAVELEPAQPEQRPMPEEREPRRRARLGHATCPSGPSKRAQQRQPVVDVAADQELGRRQPLELESLGRGRRFGRFQVGLRRLAPPAGVGQRITQLPPEQPGLRRPCPRASSSAIR